MGQGRYGVPRVIQALGRIMALPSFTVLPAVFPPVAETDKPDDQPDDNDGENSRKEAGIHIKADNARPESHVARAGERTLVQFCPEDADRCRGLRIPAVLPRTVD